MHKKLIQCKNAQIDSIIQIFYAFLRELLKYLLFLWYGFKYTSGHFTKTTSWGKHANSWPSTHSTTSYFFVVDSWTWTICIYLLVVTVFQKVYLRYPIWYLDRRCCDLLLRLTGAYTFQFTLSFFLDFTINSTGCWSSSLPKSFGFFQAILSVITFPGFPIPERLKLHVVSVANFIASQIPTLPLSANPAETVSSKGHSLQNKCVLPALFRMLII